MAFQFDPQIFNEYFIVVYLGNALQIAFRVPKTCRGEDNVMIQSMRNRRRFCRWHTTYAPFDPKDVLDGGRNILYSVKHSLLP